MTANLFYRSPGACGWTAILLLLLLAAGVRAAPAGKAWLANLAAVPYPKAEAGDQPVVQLLRQDYESLERNLSILKAPMAIGSRRFEHGLGTHSVSRIRVYSPEPIERLAAWIGVDNNERTRDGAGSVVFSVSAGGRELYRSAVMRGGGEAERIDVLIPAARVVDLAVGDAGDGPGCDHADWAEAAITTRGGKTLRLDEIKDGVTPSATSRYPFSFVYGGRPSDDLLPGWARTSSSKRLDADRTMETTTWADRETGLKLVWELVRYSDFPAADWVLYFENAGSADTLEIEDIRSMDVTFDSPIGEKVGYRLHSTRGGTPDPMQFEPYVDVVDESHPQTLGAGSGRSSTRNFPFFKIEGGAASAVVAVGWSGCWEARFECADGANLRATAGMEKTHFLLHPGERVRSPRTLILYWDGDTDEANAQFRQLIFKHYAAKMSGKPMLPMPFCNTCFTRGGGWLNECNAANQISLINAYAKLGLEALLTDAGWFEGGWPAGAGNWNPRKDAYPDGMAPVAAAARAKGMIYGLWFEPERVVAGTGIHRAHPEWCLASQAGPQDTYLLNFGLPEVQDYFSRIVKGFMELPGFAVYRQDFNMDPLPYWRYNDAPDRQGITEIKYVEGLYAYWDRIASAWPASFREECASGGHRIDLETVMRLHTAQKTDYWFDNEVDQAACWSLAQYLPNNCFVAHLIRLDDYSFHSTMASSLCLGWIADAPDFDLARGKKLVKRYRELRRLLVGAWYPLLPYSRSQREWLASQYYRKDLGEGMILAFRRAESPYRTVDVRLAGLDPEAVYEFASDATGKKTRARGKELMAGFQITLPERHSSDIIVYRKAPGAVSARK